MSKFTPGMELRVHEPQTQDGRWVFPGDRLFAAYVRERQQEVFVRSPAFSTSVWVAMENLHEPAPAVDMRALVDRVAHLEQRFEELASGRLLDPRDPIVERLGRQHDALKRRTTMLLAAVVGLLKDDDEVMLRLLTNAFATSEDPGDDTATEKED